MIEVEKKFQPTKEQLDDMLADAEFLGEVVNHDVLYDYADYRMFKNHIRLRNRNGRFEMKMPASDRGDKEIENEEEIKKFFNTDKSLVDFIAENLKLFMDITTYRKKYKKGDFNIDVDVLDSGYTLCEVELMVDDASKIDEAHQRIIDLAEKYKWEVQNLLSKRGQHLKLFRPDLYRELYGEEEYFGN